MSKGKSLVNLGCSLKCGLVVVFVFLFFISSLSCWADDAMVLPKNRWMTCLGFDIYPSWNKQYNGGGSEEDLAFDYNKELDEKVFVDLKPFADLGYDPSLGRSIVDFEKDAVITNVLISYGVTDKLSLGLKIPYWDFKTKVKTDLDKSSATMVKNLYYKNPAGPFDPDDLSSLYYSELAPAAVLSNLPPAFALSSDQIEQLKLNPENILNLLSEKYGYKRLETWSGSGIGDIDLALKYKYFQSDHWRFGLQGGVRFPTGREDDPDNLADYGFGGGNYDLFLAFQNDFIGIKNLVLNGTVRYTNQLPDKETLRTPENVNQPLTDKKERVDRDQGDIWETELSVMYSFTSGFGLNATYGAFFKDKDSVKGESGHIAALEDETRQTGHTLLVGASYNNLSRFQQKRARVPFQIALSYRDRFDGKNMNKADYYSVKGSVFF